MKWRRFIYQTVQVHTGNQPVTMIVCPTYHCTRPYRVEVEQLDLQD